MRRKLFYRNGRAGEQLDIFFISAIGSLLLVRFLLHLTEYPQLGGNGLHIGHMLWGGLLMLLSIAIGLSFIGIRVQRLAALLGGIGFGVFIDEIGKFITSDNNYFYRPTVGIIYAVFIILYLFFNFLGRKQRLTSREYQLNAMMHLEEAILHDMDPVEKRRARTLLDQASQRSEITWHLERLIDSVDLVPQSQPHILRRWLSSLDKIYDRFWQQRGTAKLVRIFFIAQAALFVVAIIANIYTSIDDVRDAFAGNVTYGTGLLMGQLISSVVAAGLVAYGTLQLAVSRLAAFEYFRRATLINLFLTEFFIFSRIEFAALPGFLFNLAMLLVITYVMHQEQEAQHRLYL